MSEVNEMSCAEFADAAAELALGVMTGRERARALAHLDRCEACRENVRQLTVTGEELVGLLPAVEPPGECLPNSEIFRRLARALGLDHPRLKESDEEMVRDVLDCDAARAAEITFERLRDEGALRVTVPGVARFAEGGFPTKSGRMRLLAPELVGRPDLLERFFLEARATSGSTVLIIEPTVHRSFP